MEIMIMHSWSRREACLQKVGVTCHLCLCTAGGKVIKTTGDILVIDRGSRVQQDTVINRVFPGELGGCGCVFMARCMCDTDLYDE